MSTPEQGSVVEGFGDEFLYSIGTLLVALLGVAWFIYMKAHSGNGQIIDPASQNTVDTVRENVTQQRSNQQAFRQSTQSRSNLVCPICLDTLRYAIETNCGHIFCGQCMVTYWHTGHWISGLRCPVDRRKVTILLKCFTTEEEQETSEAKDFVITEVDAYNRRFSGEPIPWSERVRDLPTLFYHCVREFFSANGLIFIFRVRLLFIFFAAILYFLSPLDIIPEAVFGLLGLLDDVFILFLLAVYVSLLYRQYVAQRAMDAAPEMMRTNPPRDTFSNTSPAGAAATEPMRTSSQN